MRSYSRPFARGLVLSLCVLPLLVGLTGSRSVAATRLSPRLAPSPASAKTRPAVAPKVSAAKPAVRSKNRPDDASKSGAVAIPLGARDTGPPARKAGRIATPSAGPGTVLDTEVEPNDDTDTATPIPGTSAHLRGDIDVFGDQDYYVFVAAEGDRVYAATSTAFSDNAGSFDTFIQLVGSDGTTVIQSDDDDGTFSKGSSSLAGAEIPTAGTYYLRVTEFGGADQIRPYDLYFQLRGGTSSAEVEPNDTTATAQPFPESGYVAGSTSDDLDVDLYSVELGAGDTIFLSLDVDPERDTSSFQGLVGLAGLGDPGEILTAHTGNNDPQPSGAFFFTVKSAGTYYAYVTSSSKGESGTYRLSATVFPPQTAIPCSSYASTDVPKAISDSMPSFVTSTLVVPGNPRVAHLRVNLDITHDYASDLDAVLTSPNGSRVVLFTEVGPEGPAHFDVTLDDDAALPISEFEVVDGVVVQPERDYRLGWFDGVDAGGTWTLTVYDTFEEDGGSLDGWGLEICEDDPSVCNGDTTTVFDEDFEADDGGFTHDGTNDEWEWGAPTFEPIDSANSGAKCWKTDLNGTYDDDSYQDLFSPRITLPSDGTLTLSWAQKYQIQSAEQDRAWVDIDEVDPIRGGGLHRRLWEHLGPTMEEFVGEPSIAVEESAGWSLCTRDVSEFAGKDVRITWHLDSDDVVDLAGFAVDDVLITQCVSSGGPDADVSITISDSPDPVAAGGQLTYSLLAGSGGPDDAGATTVTLPLPTGTTYVSATAPNGWTVFPPGGSRGGLPTVTFTTASFPDCDSASFTVVVSVDCDVSDGTVLSTTATIAGTTGDTDTADNSATATTTVTNDAPTIGSCPSNTSTPAAAGLCAATVTYTAPTATDDSDCTATVSCLPASGSSFPVGVTTVTCTATDAANQTSTCSFTVTVTDTVAPVVACPENMTVVATTPTGQPVTYTTPTATDNCSGATVTCFPFSGSTFPLGTTTVTCTANDASSNSSSCTFTVTVVQHDTAGVYIPSSNAWFLRNTNTSGVADVVYTYGGSPALIPIRGDWNDDGVDTPGLYDPASGAFFLRNSNTPGPADLTFTFGAPNSGYLPIAGDWNDDGTDSVGLYNPATGVFFLKNVNAAGDADFTFAFGAAGAGLLPVAGDWNDDGFDTVGVYNPVTSVFFLTNTNASGPASLAFQFGEANSGYVPIAGDWNDDGTDTVGVYSPAAAGFFLTDTIPSITADYIFVYGPANATPIVGNWDGF